jgi:hypothetical protein
MSLVAAEGAGGGPQPAEPGAAVRRFVPTLCAVLFLAFLTLDFVYLDRIPWAATVDDGAYAAAGYTLVETGRAGLPLLRGLYGLEQDMVMYGRLPAAAVGLSQRLLGVSSFADRLPNLLAVITSAGVLVGLARFCGLSGTLSLVSGLLWFVSAPARLLAHAGRPDTLLMLFTVLAVWLLLRGLDCGRVWWAGLVAGASLEVHMIGSALILTLASAAWLLSPPGRRLRNTLWFCSAAVPGFVVWLGVHVLSDWNLWTLQWGGLWAHWTPAPLLAGPRQIAGSFVNRYAAWYWNARYHRYLLEAPFLVVALAAAFGRRTREWALALIVVVFHLMLALLASGYSPGYMFAVYPLVCVLIVSACFSASPRLGPACGLLLFAFYLAQTAYWAARPDPPLPPQAATDIQRHVEGRAFLGADNLWFLFGPGSGLRSVVAATFIRVRTPEARVDDVLLQYLRGQGVEFVVQDKVFRDYVTPAQRVFFERHSEFVREYDYGAGRIVRIYRLTAP